MTLNWTCPGMIERKHSSAASAAAEFPLRIPTLERILARSSADSPWEMAVGHQNVRPMEWVPTFRGTVSSFVVLAPVLFAMP